MLQGKIAVITGASSGIGARLALAMADHGAVPVLLARSMDKLQQVGERLGNRPFGLYRTDVTSDEQVNDTVERIINKHGKVDIWVNNAGIGLFRRLEETSMDDFARLFEVNVLGTVRCTKAILPHMLEAGGGHMIMIASVAGNIGTAKSTAYTASKHAVLGFCRSLRQELLDTGVAVSAVNPGPVDTPFFATADPDGEYLSRLPSWFLLQTEDVARAVLKVIRTRHPEVHVPGLAGIGVKWNRLFPSLSERLLYRLTNRK